jgi:hypothetical protein
MGTYALGRCQRNLSHELPVSATWAAVTSATLFQPCSNELSQILKTSHESDIVIHEMDEILMLYTPRLQRARFWLFGGPEAGHWIWERVGLERRNPD